MPPDARGTAGEPAAINHLGTVSYASLDEATQEDLELLGRYAALDMLALPDRLLAAVDALDQFVCGLRVTRKEHSLQSATLALRDGRSEEYVAACLLHDIGDALAPETHGEMVAAILQPYVAEDICWVIEHHPVFQMYHYADLIGGDRHARDRYRGHPAFDACVEFCAKYDQNCFGPRSDTLTLDDFAPIVRRVFSEPRYLDRDRGG